MRGDSTGDGTVDVSDPIATLGALFLGDGELSCEDAADSNDDEEVDLSDAVHTLLYLFGGGEAPPAPGPRACGRDPDGAFPPRSPGDALGCGRHASCAPGTTGVYRLYDNGIVCVTWPCPSWTAAGEDGKEIPVTDVDMAPLGLPPEKAQEVWLELGEGRWRVRGYTVPGPEGPAGIGTTFVVLELVEPAGEAG
ncbi:MAG: hypothetical protein HY721_02130 [Planctomycetes bacterium]|nr:hypothetical protein [Planctomycetota bacterium]